jgi:hypothetical protein
MKTRDELKRMLFETRVREEVEKQVSQIVLELQHQFQLRLLEQVAQMKMVTRTDQPFSHEEFQVLQKVLYPAIMYDKDGKSYVGSNASDETRRKAWDLLWARKKVLARPEVKPVGNRPPTLPPTVEELLRHKARVDAQRAAERKAKREAKKNG